MSDPTEIRWPAAWPRPTRLFARPEPVDTMALLPDHPPVHFVWRGVRRRVTRADGPERIYGEWHLSDAEFLGVRAYFQVARSEERRVGKECVSKGRSRRYACR